MTMLVTLDEAKDHCEVTIDSHDEKITIYIKSASAAVLAYIGDSQYDFLDTGGEDLILDEATEQPALRARDLCRQATLLLVEDFFKNRGSSATDPVPERFGYGYLPRTVVALLMKLRTPTVV